jgi:hypothetical protein
MRPGPRIEGSINIVRCGDAYDVTFTPHGDWPPAPPTCLGGDGVVRLLHDIGIRRSRITEIMDDLRQRDVFELPIVIITTAHRRRFGL